MLRQMRLLKFVPSGRDTLQPVSPCNQCCFEGSRVAQGAEQSAGSVGAETEVGGEGVGCEVCVFVERDVGRLDVDAVEGADEGVVDECEFGCGLGSWGASRGCGGGERENGHGSVFPGESLVVVGISHCG
jgi:hypothetical protein